jgi:class 3 adenylate cyclase/tetratricopeptide (TPR) repeat protein
MRRADEELSAIDVAISVLEAQRPVLGDAVVETALEPLREKRREVQSRLDGEQRKLVTVLFSDLVDFTVLSQRLDAEDVRTVVNLYFGRWQDEIAANGGVIEKFIGDAVMAVFGLHQAREDDPHRAIRAALALRASLDELNATLEATYGVRLQMRVGIDTGEVVVGLLDERPGQEVAVVGETVNRTARLQAAAPPGGILISADTLRHVRGSFALQPLPGLELKGIEAPVDGYLVLSERPRGFRLDAARGVEGVETRTIGRQLELRQLQEHFAEVVEERQWRVVTIVGDAGVGKSRLLGELDGWLAEIPDELWWFRGRASPAGENRPNALLRDVIVSRLEIQESDGPDEVVEKWHRGFDRVFGSGEESRRKSAVIAKWLGFDLGEDDVVGVSGSPDSQRLRERAVEYTAECFCRLGLESPVVVLLEDLHWADDGSLDWMDDAAPLLRNSPVLVVATARPSLLERRPHWGEGLSHHARLRLPSLSRRQSRQMVGELLRKADHVPEALCDLVVEAADGNPFYIEELIRWLLDAGVIVKDGERWTIAEEAIEQAPVPSTLRGVLQARLDALPPAEHRTLQRAAVIGRVFWDDAVERLQSLTRPDAVSAPVNESLELLRGREVVFKREQSVFEGAGEYLFKHALLRDVAYDSVLRAHRQTYHGLAARWLEQMTERSRRADQYAGLIADHHERAGDASAAAHWYLRAGRQAAAVHGLQEATRLLDRGVTLAADDERALRFDLLLARENVLNQLGDRDAQLADLAAAEEALADLDDPARCIEVLLARIRFAFNASAYREQAELAGRAVELARESGLADKEAQGLLWWGFGLAWEGEHDAADEVLDQALAQARATGQTKLAGEALRYRAIVANNRSDFPAALARLDEARAIHRGNQDAEGEGLVIAQAASVLYNQGRYQEAREQLEAALPIFAASGFKYRQAIVLGNLGTILMAHGELGEARRLLVEGLALCEEVRDREGTATGLGTIGDLYRRVGDFDRAKDNLLRSLAEAPEIDASYLVSDSLFGLALVAAAQGDLDEALKWSDEATDEGARSESQLALARARFGQGVVRSARGELDAAAAALADARRRADDLELANLALEATASLARVRLAEGRVSEALALVEPLLDHLDVAGLEGATEPGQVFVDVWRVLDAAGDERREAVLAAAGTFLDELAGRIDEDDLREGFLERVPAHAELAAALGRTPGHPPHPRPPA